MTHGDRRTVNYAQNQGDEAQVLEYDVVDSVSLSMSQQLSTEDATMASSGRNQATMNMMQSQSQMGMSQQMDPRMQQSQMQVQNNPSAPSSVSNFVWDGKNSMYGAASSARNSSAMGGSVAAENLGGGERAGRGGPGTIMGGGSKTVYGSSSKKAMSSTMGAVGGGFEKGKEKLNKVKSSPKPLA